MTIETIETKEQVDIVIKAICIWIAKQPVGDVNRYSGEMESVVAEDIRRWAAELLDTAHADGIGGCRLCQS